ncbi:hypothetical protein LP316_02625 [Thalassotalea sp. LPB0316]|uniref:M14 family zinc carboxypeptidase n=1 Tax=Thalassotalea sp. LPB0316 TaxID=2769490 RepID=UPI0018666561|nr:M14 family zinc carboxypeptidase [Thalassotalea sp. LPB0316]QOL26214.1 hypothetical protein LP316_02625 [Thalassotalea sp. LPB0316]
MSLSRILMLFALFSTSVFALPVEQFLPKNSQHDIAIAKPEQVLGFEVGERHVRHFQVVNYMQTLAQQSDRVLIEEFGRTFQQRPQLLLTISSPKNLARLDEIIANRQLPNKQKPKDEPLVIWLGYSVHGDEISGTNAALVVAYHLAASQDNAVKQLLDEAIIVIEPSINPDGMDRFVNWVDTFRGASFNSDPNHIEHHQNWPTGRTNHFWFDLNRDWLLLSQIESKNRIKQFHKYAPHVLGDFHEMGANSTYFFQPGIPSRTHPLTPESNITLTNELANYHASALDQTKQLYFSQESFDDFYYGKGSTYPDINASVGILFEQASSRGFAQETINGLLTFDQTIANQVTTSFSTIEGAWQNKDKLKAHRKQFYLDGFKLASNQDFKGYLFSVNNDDYRLHSFIEKLQAHQVKVYQTSRDQTINGKLFKAKQSFYVPLAQAQYRMIEAMFNQQTDFRDNTFYDVSGWTIPLAMNITFEAITKTSGLGLAKQNYQINTQTTAPFTSGAYAYAFDWSHSLAPKLLNQLLKKDIKVRVSTQDFSVTSQGNVVDFNAGTIVIPAGIQTADNWEQTLSALSAKNGIEISALDTGLTVKGIDLGSRNMQIISPINVLLVGGKGVSQYEAGEVLYYLDNLMQIPVSVVEKQRLASIDLTRYSHIMLVNGRYRDLSEVAINNLALWLENGGVMIGQKAGAQWLAQQSWLRADFVSKATLDDLFDTSSLGYGDKEALGARKRIAGAIYQSELDLSHPLTFGYQQKTLPLFKNSTLIMRQPQTPFISVATYSDKPLMSGYSDRNLVNQIANNSAIIAHNYGKGRVIGFTDNLTFRGYWLGSAKLLANSLFFSKAFSAQAPRQAQD